MAIQDHTKLRYYAPRRESVCTGTRVVQDTIFSEDRHGQIHEKVIQHTINTYKTVPWTLTGVLSTIAGGGWFAGPTSHDFEPGVAEFAGDARIVYTDLMQGRKQGDRHAA